MLAYQYILREGKYATNTWIFIECKVRCLTFLRSKLLNLKPFITHPVGSILNINLTLNLNLNLILNLNLNLNYPNSNPEPKPNSKPNPKPKPKL